MEYYVYGLFEKLEDSILDDCFYIGKGCNYRKDKHFCNSKIGENPHKDRKINKIKENGREVYASEIITNLTEDESYELENFIISEIGLDNLTNILPGGSGFSSGKDHPMHGVTGDDHPMSNVTGKDHPMYGVNRKGENHPFYGRSHSEETKNKIRKNHLKSKHFGEENHPTSKLSKLEAREVKWLSKNSNLYQREIAEIYNIKQVTVSDIKCGRSWKNITPRKPKDYR